MKKTVLVTGSTRGIGKEIALRFLEKKYFVILNGISDEDELINELKDFEEYNNMYEYYMFDITNREAVRENIKKIIDKYSKIDVLVNNAGITMDKTLIKLEHFMWDEVINVNLTGAFNLCKEVVPTMIKNGFGRIINISSVVGLSGNFGQTNYSASKAGLIGFSKSLALEVARYGITVNSIAPGYLKTEMTQKIPHNIIEKVKTQIPVGYLGEPKDVANVAIFLASKESRYITGETVSVNGGMHLK